MESHGKSVRRKFCQSNQSCWTSTSEKKFITKSSDSTIEDNEMEMAVDKIYGKNEIIEPKTQIVSKPFMSKFSCQETIEKVEIKIKFHGYKFKAENRDVQVVNRS